MIFHFIKWLRSNRSVPWKYYKWVASKRVVQVVGYDLAGCPIQPSSTLIRAYLKDGSVWEQYITILDGIPLSIKSLSFSQMKTEILRLHAQRVEVAIKVACEILEKELDR